MKTLAPFLVGLPPKELSPNGTSGLHWSKTSAAKRAYKADCCVCVPRELRNLYLTACTVHFIVYAQRGPIPDGCYRPLDRQNFISAFKHGFDALEEMGVVTNDKVIKVGEVELRRTRQQCKGKIGVLVIVEIPE